MDLTSPLRRGRSHPRRDHSSPQTEALCFKVPGASGTPSSGRKRVRGSTRPAPPDLSFLPSASPNPAKPRTKPVHAQLFSPLKRDLAPQVIICLVPCSSVTAPRCTRAPLLTPTACARPQRGDPGSPYVSPAKARSDVRVQRGHESMPTTPAKRRPQSAHAGTQSSHRGSPHTLMAIPCPPDTPLVLRVFPSSKVWGWRAVSTSPATFLRARVLVSFRTQNRRGHRPRARSTRSLSGHNPHSPKAPKLRREGGVGSGDRASALRLGQAPRGGALGTRTTE